MKLMFSDNRKVFSASSEAVPFQPIYEKLLYKIAACKIEIPLKGMVLRTAILE